MRITFDQCDSTEEVCGLFNKVFANQEQLEAKIIQLNERVENISGVIDLMTPAPTAVKEKPKKKGKSKMKPKGSVHTRTLAVLMLVLAIAGLCYGAYVTTDINYDIASNPEMLSQYLRDSFGNITSNSYLFTPTTTAPAHSKGKVYYHTTDGLEVSDGSAWAQIDLAGGVSLDGAYDFGGAGLGKTITATDGAVTIQNTEADSAALLSLSYTTGAQTGDALLITISGGTADGIEIENTGSGYDIEGTGANFYVDKNGNIVCVDLTTSDDVLFAGTNYDVAFDDSRDLFIFQDNVILGLGGDHDGVADVTYKFDGTNLLVEAVSDNAGQIRVGSTNAIDWAHYGSSNAKIALWDASVPELLLTDYDIQFDNDSDLIIGTDNDWVIESDTADTLEILTKLTDGTAAVNLGVDGAGADLKMFSEVSGNYVEFDSTADEVYHEDCDLKLNEGAQIEFCYTDNGTDWTIDLATANRLTFTPALTNDTATFHIGTADNTSDVVAYMKTAGETLTIDASEDSLTFVGDLALYTLTGTTKPFYVNVTGTVAGVATELKTTDGGIKFDADGANNGDITIDAADVLTLTSVDYKMFDGATTEVWRIDGTAAGSYHSISFTDATANVVWTFPDGGAGTVGVMSTSLATNFVDKANSVTGGSNQIIFEGSDADTEETIIQATDPTADIIWILPDGGADSLAFVGSTMTTNYPEVANSVWMASNEIRFEGAAADAFESVITSADITGGVVTWTLADMGAADILSVMGSTLTTNAPEIANSIWGDTNKLAFEGATANDFETWITPTNATADRTITLPDKTGTVMLSSAASALTPSAAVTLTVGLSNLYTDTVTDNEDQTITFSGAGTAGDVITIVFTTAGAADEVITFHATLVSSTGTLTIGTTAARYYSITFISNGSHWYEVSRTAEQT